MLKLAFPYREQLDQLFMERAFDEKYKYYNDTTYYNGPVEFNNGTWDSIPMVSVDENDQILGFFQAKIDRPAESVHSLAAINFYDLNYTFSKDFHNFIHDLFFKFNFRKVNFSVVIPNPAEQMYDKYVQKYGGKVAGYYKKHSRLYDGNYYDLKVYEIFREDIIRAREEVVRGNQKRRNLSNSFV